MIRVTATMVAASIFGGYFSGNVPEKDPQEMEAAKACGGYAFVTRHRA